MHNHALTSHQWDGLVWRRNWVSPQERREKSLRSGVDTLTKKTFPEILEKIDLLFLNFIITTTNKQTNKQTNKKIKVTTKEMNSEMMKSGNYDKKTMYEMYLYSNNVVRKTNNDLKLYSNMTAKLLNQYFTKNNVDKIGRAHV